MSKGGASVESGQRKPSWLLAWTLDWSRFMDCLNNKSGGGKKERARAPKSLIGTIRQNFKRMGSRARKESFHFAKLLSSISTVECDFVDNVPEEPRPTGNEQRDEPTCKTISNISVHRHRPRSIVEKDRKIMNFIPLSKDQND